MASEYDGIHAARFTVKGRPIPQPRARHTIRTAANGHQWVSAYVPSDDPVHTWKACVVDAWRMIMPTPGFRFVGPLAVLLQFVQPRPADKIWKKKPMPRYLDERTGAGGGTKSGDADNLAKAVYDALNGKCWGDDFEIAWAWQEKWIAGGSEQPHLRVFVAELDLQASSLFDMLVDAVMRASLPMTGPPLELRAAEGPPPF